MSAKKSGAKSFAAKGSSSTKSAKPGNSSVGKEAFQGISAKLNSASELIIKKLDSMEEGDKVTLKELGELVTNELEIPVANLNPLINLVVDEYPGLSRAKGRNGGIYKGDAPKTARELDTRARCPHCKQVMRGKKKKEKSQESVTTES